MRRVAAFVLLGMLLVSPLTPLSAQSRPEDLITRVTRAESAMILLVSLGEYIPELKNDGQYPDLIDGQWYVRYVLEAARRRILDPRPSSGLMTPHRAVTRAEFIKMMTIAFGLPTNLSSSFSDVKQTDWFAPYAGIAYRHSLFSDPQNLGKMHPNVLISHEEAASALRKILVQYPNLRRFSEGHVRRSLARASNIPVSSQPAPSTTNGTKQFTTANLVKRSLQTTLQVNAERSANAKQEVIDAVNRERAKLGLNPLRENALLSLSSKRHAEDMSKRGYFSHVTPEGVTYVQRIRQVGYMSPNENTCACFGYCSCSPTFAVGENIAQGQLTSDEVMKDWMASPSHRRNIVHPDFTEIGVGLFGKVWVQNFGKVSFSEF